MKKLSGITIFALLMSSSEANATLSFTAAVENENLAEEAIMLAQCLAERSGEAWEFSGETRGDHWLKVRQEGQQLRLIYRQGKQETAETWKSGSIEEVCAKLEPGSEKSSTEPFQPRLASGPRNLDPSLPEEVTSEKNRKPWIWIGIGAAALTGFLLWRAGQPNHLGLEMH